MGANRGRVLPVSLQAAVSLGAGPSAGIALFEQHCSTCHSAPAAGSRAPDRLALESADAGSDSRRHHDWRDGGQRRRADAGAEARRRRDIWRCVPLASLGVGCASRDEEPCAAKPLGDPTTGAKWNGWGVDAGNTRFQPQPRRGSPPAQVPNAEAEVGLRVSQRYVGVRPAGSRRRTRLRRLGQRLRLRARRGERLRATGRSRRRPACAPRSASARSSSGRSRSPRYAVYFGDLKGNVYAVDAESRRDALDETRPTRIR